MDIATLGLAIDSRPAKEAAKALDSLTDAGKRAEVVTHKVEASFDAEALAAATAKGAVVGLTAALAANGEAQRKEEAASRAAAKAAKDATGAQDDLAGAYNRSAIAITAAIASAALLVKGYIGVADSVTVLNNQLKLATGSTEAAAKASAGLYEIAQRSRVNFLELGGTYASIARNAGEMGIAQSRVLKVTESIANAMTISGGSAASMNAALVQLGQGMSSGVLRGEELNSVMEQAPRLAKALADGLGVPIGRLREMGAAGEITAQQVVKALESQSAVLAGEVAGATMTVGQSFVQLTNASTRAIGEFDAASGSSAALAAAISAGAGAVDTLGTAFKNNQGVIQTVMGAIAGGAVLATLGALPSAIGAVTAALTGLGVVLSANPVVLALLGIGAVVGGGVAAVNALAKTDSGIKDAIRSLQAENERSEAALERAIAGGRGSGADNIRKVIEERKKAIRELNAEMALRDNAGAANPAEDARFAASTAAKKAEEAAARELTGIRQKLYKVDADYLPTLQKLHQQYQDGRISLQEYRADVEALAKANYKAATPKGPKTPAKASEEAQAYAKYYTDFSKAANAAQGEVDELTKSQTKLAAMLVDPVFQKMPETWRQTTLQAAYAAIAVEQEADAQDANTKALKAATVARDADIKKTVASTASDNAKAQALEDEIALWGKSEEAIKALTIARLEDEKAVQMSYGDTDAVQAIEDRIAAIKRLAVATDKVNGLKAADKAAKDAAGEWERASNKIESDITNALMRGFESGKGFAENLRDVLVNMFKSMILEPTIRGIVSPAVGAVQSALGLGGGSGGGSLLSLFGGSGGGLGGLLGQFGSGFSGSASAASAMMGGAPLTGAASLGSMAAAAAPWIAGAFALKSLTDYKVESRGSGLTATLAAGGLPSGSVGMYNEFQQTGGVGGGGVTINRDWLTAGQDVADYMAGSVKAATTSVKSFAAALGLAPEAVDGFTKAIEISITGLSPEQQTAAINDAIAGFASDMAQSAYGGALEGLTRTGETSGQTLQRLATDLTGVNDALGQLGLAILPVGINGAATASALVSAFGGLEQMQTSVGAYYNAIYTDAEKAAQATAKLDAQFAALGISVPANEAAFKTLVEGIDITTVEGQRLAASVINLAPAFSQASQAARAAANNMMAAISNWGSSGDLRAFKAQQLQQSLAAGGLNLSLDQIMGATQESALQYYQSLDPNSAQAQVLLANQQAIYDFVQGGRQIAQNPVEQSSGAGGAVADAQSAASAILDAWQGITDGIFDEANRIRGLMGIGRTGSLSEAQTAFTIANAQANAGDPNAARSLPALGRNVVSLATASATSLQDLRRIQGQTALTLERTGVNLAGRYGTNIPADMLPFVQNGATNTSSGAATTSSAGTVSTSNWSPEWAQLLEACKQTQINTRTVANLLTGAMPAQTRLQVQVITP